MKIKFINNLFFQRKKILKVLMRTFIFLLCSTTFGFTSSDIFSQNTKIHIDKDQVVSIDTVFDLLREQTDYTFIYEEDLFKGASKVQLKKGTIRANKLLETCFSGKDFKLELKGNKIIIIANNPTTGLQQTFTVSGAIFDTDGQPLPGANIVEKGTTNGVTADFDGNFSISVDNGNGTLVVSYIGFATKEVIVNGQSILNITLSENASGLDEVVVIGYGTAAKKDLTGSVVSVDFDDANIAPNTSVLQAIQGRLPGINIGAVSDAGQDPELSIRGQNSLSASNAPLVVVDGVIYSGSLLDLSASDIKNVAFLKDASAAAVYGSRAANGVVMVTTKTGSGEIGKPKITLNSYVGFQKAANTLDLMNGEKYIQRLIDYGQATAQDITPGNITQYLNQNEVDNYLNGNEVNWNDLLLRTAPIRNYELGLSGRSEKTRYYLSGSFTDQDGVVKGDDFNRTTLRTNISTDITDWLTLGLNASYSSRDYSGGEVTFGNSILSSPYGTIYQADNHAEYETFPQTDQLISNPFLGLTVDDEEYIDNLFGILNVDVDIPVEGLTYKFSFSKNINSSRHSIFQTNTKEGLDLNGIATRDFENQDSYLMNNILTYDKEFKNLHKIQATAVYTRDHEEVEFSSMRATDFGNKGLGYHAMELGVNQTVSSGATDQSSEGFMTRINYGYNSKYLLTGTFRRDGFSGFAANHKYANFFSASAAWVMSQESFMESLDWIDFLKMRLSYGENGNQGLGSYGSLSSVETSQYVFGDGSRTYNGFQTVTMANPDLKWETTKSVNYGVNFNLLDGRISGALDMYKSKTIDLLVQRSLPRYTGYTTTWRNLGEIQNKGVEILLNSVNLKSENLIWETGFTFSSNRNKIISLYGEDADGDGFEDDDIDRGWFIGESLGAIYGYMTGKIYQLGDEIPNGFKEGFFEIIDNDGIEGISPDDRVIYGNTDPNYRFGIINTFRYKNLSISGFVNSVQGGNNWYLGDNIALNPNSFFPDRANMVDIDYWTPTNPSNSVPAINYSPLYAHRFDQDRSFVRLQDVTIAYNLKDSFLKKTGLNNLRIYVSGKNLATWTNWTGYDPELGTTLSGKQGLDGRPIMKSYVFGVEIGL